MRNFCANKPDFGTMLSTARILLIDDDAGMRSMLERNVARADLALECAASAEEGMALFAQRSFDLVILDLSLPDGDGLDIARKIRRQGETPMIILSGRADDVDRIVGLEIGAALRGKQSRTEMVILTVLGDEPAFNNALILPS